MVPVACWDALTAPSGTIGTWTDIKGFQVSSTGAARPTNARQDGFPSVVFDGVDDKLDLAAGQRLLMASRINGGSGFSLVTISTLLATTAIDRQYFRANYTGGTSMVIAMYRTTDTGRLQFRAQSAGTLLFTNLTNGVFPQGGPHFMSGEFEATSGSIDLFDSPATSQSGTPGASTIVVSGIDTFIVGAGFSFANHALHAQIIFRQALNAGVRHAIRLWGWHRFGFHPG
jgi:hypothetical protein